MHVRKEQAPTIASNLKLYLSNQISTLCLKVAYTGDEVYALINNAATLNWALYPFHSARSTMICFCLVTDKGRFIFIGSAGGNCLHQNFADSFG